MKQTKNGHHKIKVPLSSMVLLPVTEKEVASVIKQFKAKKSTDINGLSMFIVKQCHGQIIIPLTKVINCSFEKGIFPNLLKIAFIIDPKERSNYRPISI